MRILTVSNIRTSILNTAWSPSGSLAVTVTNVTKAALTALASIFTVLPDTETPIAFASEGETSYESKSSSGSRKYGETSTAMVWLTTIVWVEMLPTVSGRRLGYLTVTLIACVASSPPGSRAVTVTVAVPSSSALINTRLPSTLSEIATAVSLDTAL